METEIERQDTATGPEAAYEPPDPMRRARRGKIARLPRRIREQLNHRLASGESAPSILDWVNELPEVIELLDIEFQGRDISTNNLSEWRLGGFKEWERQQATCERLRALGDRAGQFQDAAEGRVGDHLAQIFALELLDMLERVLDETTSTQERWKCLREGLREIRMLRRADHSAGRLALAEAQWETRRRQAAEDREKAADRASQRRILDQMLLARAMGVNSAPASVPPDPEEARVLEIMRQVDEEMALEQAQEAKAQSQPPVTHQNGVEIQPENQPKNQGNPTISNQIQPPQKNGHAPFSPSRPLTRKEALAQYGLGPPAPPLNIHPAKKSSPKP